MPTLPPGEHVAIGPSRHTGAADWGPRGGSEERALHPGDACRGERVLVSTALERRIRPRAF